MTEEAKTASAVLFDIDGTLVDSNYLHVHAWYRAFEEVGHPVEAWRIHRSIGMDGTTLVNTLGAEADEETRSQAEDLHSRYYKELAPHLRQLPGARGLLEAVHKLDIRVVLATSAPEEELSVLREVLDSDHLVYAVTSSEDVDTAKPEPDIVEVALERAGVPASHAVFVGDTIWDVEACKRAGVDSIAVLSGGVSRSELEKAGAQRVFGHALELCQHLDDTPIAALANIVGAR
ncbi:haloacid dehalogenase superfamily protein [Mycolicibacterium flavescens]|uniref:HAD family hydrolase n=1 Tax=Mycobacterium TaxID=1763 RepID=UPI0007FCA295|nr:MULTISPECIES: HAD family hydrolase [Mycobacterium]OBF93100.1 HAD family hydrolase [Mycobacterium sp. 852002-51152_SCH6134967]VEG41556.1 haloacid dehalogenase superfamily protein [Mycolicibacterium flavescens]